MTMSERAKALAGLHYDISDRELRNLRARIRQALHVHNHSVPDEDAGPG